MRKDRLKHILLFIYLAFTFIIITLVKLQIFNSNYWESISIKQSQIDYKYSGRRGEIKTADGIIIAYNKIFYIIEIDCSIEDKISLSKFIKKFFEINEIDFINSIKSKKYHLLPFELEYKTKFIIENDPDFKILKKFIYFKEKTKRLYINEEFKSIIGFLKEGKGNHGIEKVFNSELSGKEHNYKKQVSANGSYEVNRDIEHESNGSDISLTIDSKMQHILTYYLAKGLELNKASSGTGIILNPKNGKILALSSMPNISNKFLKNRAISDIYEPGSIIKPFVVAAAIDSGSINQDYQCYTDGSITLHGNVIKDEIFCKKGYLNLEEAIGYSTNVGMVDIASKIDSKIFMNYLINFGFGNKTGVDLYAEVRGILPPLKKWNKVTKSYMSFGYNIACTPMQIAIAFSSLVNGGILFKPQIVEKLTLNNRDKKLQNEPLREVISLHTSNYIKKAIISSYEKGTGKFVKMDGYSIGCKTGTTKKLENGNYTKSYTPTFIAVFPGEDPDYLIFIQIDNPKGKNIYGSNVAAPIFKKIFKKIIQYKNLLPGGLN